MNIQKITGVVGTIQRIVDNKNITVGYKLNRISALLGTLNYDLRLLNESANEGCTSVLPDTNP